MEVWTDFLVLPNPGRMLLGNAAARSATVGLSYDESWIPE